MREIAIDPMPLERLAGLLAPDRAERFVAAAGDARNALGGRTVWNVNATGQGGGVAEMLQTFVGYARSAGIDSRWLVLDGDPAFFAITKRIHNLLHGSDGDGGGLGEAERGHYDAVLAHNLDALLTHVRPGDLVLLHDPQTAGLVDGLREHGAIVVWRCHVGSDEHTAQTRRVWEFLRPLVEHADAFVFTRRAYAPDWVPADRLAIIAPSIDPFSAKNAPIEPAAVRNALRTAGLVAFAPEPDGLGFRRRNGAAGEVRPHRGLLHGDDPLPADARIVLQVSRWDHLKDMQGVLRAFVAHLDGLPPDAHLLLTGPATEGVSDDPEGAEVLAECLAARDALPPAARARVHLASLPMDDIDENAHLVNALQRHAAVVVQKSLVEGFGLTVTEPMWKGRPVVASAVGGIRDQIRDEIDGLLLADPRDDAELGAALARVLHDGALAGRLGRAATERVRDHFLGDRHLLQYAGLLTGLVGVAASS